MNDPDDIDDEDDLRTQRALADAARLTNSDCANCGQVLCGHDAVFALVLGYKNAARCLRCVAAHMREPLTDLRERTLDYVQHHECFLAAWHHAGEVEGFGATARPPCLWDLTEAAAPAPAGAAGETAVAAAESSAAVTSWNAGDMACGDLVLELRLRLRDLPPGGLLDLVATDAAAPVDLPAWCNLTGHALVAQDHPNYRIRRRG